MQQFCFVERNFVSRTAEAGGIKIATLDKKISTDSESSPKVNPVKDIMTSNVRQRLQVSEADMEILRQLKENPPPPTPELIEILKQNRKCS